MARYVKLGTLGGYKDVPGGQSDPECTHVILTKKEYDQLHREKAVAESEASRTKHEAERAISDAKRGAQYTAQHAAAEAQKKVCLLYTSDAADDV